MGSDRYGCFNRLVYVESYRAVDSRVLYGDYANRSSRVIDVPTTAKTKCQFTLSSLGITDLRCDQCVHKVIPKAPNED